MTVEFWIGQNFETEHEHRALASFLRDMQDKFANSQDCYFILADFLIEGSQVDLTVLKHDAIVVIELKECREPFRATENGPWRLTSIDGKTVGAGGENPFEQVRRYRIRWVDFLKKHQNQFLSSTNVKPLGFNHVNAIVCISPRLHQAVKNEVTVDWFQLVGLNQLSQTIYQINTAVNFSADEVRKLIQLLNLRPGDKEAAKILEEAMQPYSPFFDVPPLPRIDFIGRQSERTTLDECLKDKTTAVINVRGPEGVGRTELVAWICKKAVVPGFRIKWVYCRQKDVTLQALLAAIATEVPNWQQANYICDLKETPLDRVSAALDYLDEKPTLLVLDDYDAIAQPKLLEVFLTRLVRHAKQVRVVLTTQVRPGCVDNPEWRRHAVLEIALEGLPHEYTCQFLGPETCEQLAPGQLDEIWQRTSGIPYLVCILAKIVRDTGKMPTSSSLLKNEILGSWFSSLLATLSSSAQQLAHKLSVIRGTLDPKLVRYMSRPDEKTVDKVSHELIDHYILRKIENTDEVIMHELVRDYLYTRASAKVKRSAHASAGTYFTSLAERAPRIGTFRVSSSGTLSS